MATVTAVRIYTIRLFRISEIFDRRCPKENHILARVKYRAKFMHN